MAPVESISSKIDSFHTELDRIAIATNKSHCIILYKSEDKAFTLHLEWHFVLKNESISKVQDENYYWIRSSIHKLRQPSIAAFCKTVYDRNDQGIPYGIVYEGGKFNEDGTLILEGEEHGFTCATFVMAFFKSVGIQLIDIHNWDIRESDTEFHEKVVHYLERTQASKAHIEKVRHNVGCARFRPTEVTVSSYFDPNPGDSKEIQILSTSLEKYIESA